MHNLYSAKNDIMQVLVCWYQNNNKVNKIMNQFQTSIWRQTLSISTVGTPLQRILQTRRRFQCECINSNMLCVNPSLPAPSNQNQTPLTQSNPSPSTIHNISIYSKKVFQNDMCNFALGRDLY